MKSIIRHRWTILFLALLMTLPPLAASASKPLPDFGVTALNGQAVRSNQLSSMDKWLLIYVEPNCEGCEKVLRVFQRDIPATDMGQKVIVVVGGQTAQAAKLMAAKYPWVPEASWYADPAKGTVTALELHGTPVVLGIGKGNVEWTRAGALEAKKLKAILMTWCEG